LEVSGRGGILLIGAVDGGERKVLNKENRKRKRRKKTTNTSKHLGGRRINEVTSPCGGQREKKAIFQCDQTECCCMHARKGERGKGRGATKIRIYPEEKNTLINHTQEKDKGKNAAVQKVRLTVVSSR